MVVRLNMLKIYKVMVKFSPVQKLVINENALEIDISINVLPAKGRANNEIVKKLSKYFNVKPSNIVIVLGKFSNTMTVQVQTEI